MIREIIGTLGLAYALRTPTHRGKFRMLQLLDLLFGPFILTNRREGLRLTVYLSSSMDTSYFRPPSGSATEAIDEIAPALIKQLKPGDTFVDIGANIGFLSVMAARQVGPTGFVLAIEPSAREYTRLLANIRLNNVINVLPIHAALGDRSGVVELEVAPHHTGLNRLSNRGHSAGDRVKVAMLDGSELFASLIPSNTRPALVKIDVEGAEVTVLRGLKTYLAKNLPAKVVVEITPRFLADFGSTRQELYGLMAEIGYDAQFNREVEQCDEIFTPRSPGPDLPAGIDR